MHVVFLTLFLALWPLVLGWLASRTSAAGWLGSALFPGLGLNYLCLFVLGDLENPLLVRMGLQFGELASLTAGKSLGNLLEIPAVFLAAAWARARLIREQRQASGTGEYRPGQFIVACYAGAWGFYFFMPMLPE